MRIVTTSIILAAMTAGAQASSIIMLGSAAEGTGPSMILLGSPARTVTASVVIIAGSESPKRPSIVAFGEPAPSVDHEKVAAIPAVEKATPRKPAQLPMVIRGGLAGDAFARADTAPQAPQQEKPAPDSEPAEPSGPTIRLAPPREEASSSEPPVQAEEVPDGPVLQ